MWGLTHDAEGMWRQKLTRSNAKIDSFSERRPGGGATAGAKSACRAHMVPSRTWKCEHAPETGALPALRDSSPHILHMFSAAKKEWFSAHHPQPKETYPCTSSTLTLWPLTLRAPVERLTASIYKYQGCLLAYVRERVRGSVCLCLFAVCL